MHPIAMIDVITVLSWTLICAVILARWTTPVARRMKPVMLGFAGFSLFHSLFMFLGWAGVTNELEAVEDLIGATLPMWWAFVFYTVAQEISRKDLHAREAELRSAQAIAHVGSWRVDVAADVFTGSDEALHIFGRPGGERITYGELLDVVHQGDRRLVNDAWEAALAGAPLDIEHRILVDGQIRWVRQKMNIEPGGAGDVRRGVGFVQDITDQKRAEEAVVAQAEAERRLLRELDHRVRNNLSSLISLIDISRSSAQNIDDLAAAIRGRAQTIVAVHSLLASNKWRGSEFRRLLNALIHTDHRTEIRFTGPDVTIPPVQAQAVGIIINELATNSRKYGAMSSDDGSLLVAWEASPLDDATVELTARWEERGGPPVDHTPIEGVGTSLVTGLAESELRGRAELTYPRDGARHTLRFRLAESGTAQFEPIAASRLTS
jgi:PAS domain S-box-containing protein